MQALVDAKTEIVTLVGKSWDLHVKDILNVSEEENLAMIRDSVAYSASRGATRDLRRRAFFRRLRIAIPILPCATIQAAQEGGAELVVAVRYERGQSARADRGRAWMRARKALSIPVGIHCHNDCDVATANSLMAVRHGAVQVQGTINGIGERCGNVDLISVVANLVLKQGCEALAGGGGRHLTELSRYVYEIANMNFPREPAVRRE